jgi:hypothetical protein
LNFNENWPKALNLRSLFEKLVLTPEQLATLKNAAGAAPEQIEAIHKRLEFADTITTMSAFAVMLVVLVAVGTAGRFMRKTAAKKPAPPAGPAR